MVRIKRDHAFANQINSMGSSDYYEHSIILHKNYCILYICDFKVKLSKHSQIVSTFSPVYVNIAPNRHSGYSIHSTYLVTPRLWEDPAMCNGESLSCRPANTEQNSVSGAVLCSLLSGDREPDRIVFIIPFEVTTPFQRPSYSYVLIMEENKERVESGGRAAASKTMEAIRVWNKA